MAAAAGDYLLSNLTCALCKQVYREPVVLRCGHNFCKACIEGKWGAGGSRSCPTCHRAHPDRQFTVNRALASLVQKQRKEPQAAARDAGKRDAKCEEHQENIRLYCCIDGMVCCVVCRDAIKHVGHDFLPLPDATAMYKSQLESITELIESEKEIMQNLVRNQEEQLDRLRVNYLQLKNHITSEFEILQKALHTQENELLEKLRVQEEVMKGEMEENLLKLKSECQRMETSISSNIARVVQEDPVTFLMDVKSYLERCQAEQERFILMEYEVITKELCLGTFKGPLQYATWKKMKSTIKPVAACLTLDPSTAHPHLTISENKTQVKHRRTLQRLPYNPERSTHYKIAQASVGFTSGQHYWEVEVGVGDRTRWYIGVVKESVNRKQRTDASAKDGYWAIGQAREAKYVILDTPPKPLPLTSRPQKIGVYLDYEGAQISLYDARDMSHLHTFTDAFDARLFPYFSPGYSRSDDNTEPIKLFQPQI